MSDVSLIFEIYRKSAQSEAHFDRVVYEWDGSAASVATVLREFEQRSPLRDVDGRDIPPVSWECSCLQKKCGACAMLVCGRPRLACDCMLSEFSADRPIRLEPLKKFPHVKDLVVDRSAMRESLKQSRLWFHEAADTKNEEDAYDASRCLQCACCLEICPNFYTGGDFGGMAAMLPAARILSQSDKGAEKELKKLYEKRVYEGCGASLACRDICPAGINMERLLARSNAAAVWRRGYKEAGGKNSETGA